MLMENKNEEQGTENDIDTDIKELLKELEQERTVLTGALVHLEKMGEVEDATRLRAETAQRQVNEALQRVLDEKLKIIKAQDAIIDAYSRALDARALCIDTMWLSLALATPEDIERFQERLCEEGVPRSLAGGEVYVD